MVSSKLGSYTVTCKLCHQEHNILANKDDVFDWLTNTKYIQDALWYLSSSERELFISSTCDTCWKKMYGEDDAE